MSGMPPDPPGGETVYSARAGLADPRRFLAEAAQDLRRARRSAWRLFRSDLRARHRRSILGYLWLLLPAAGTALICSFVHARQIVSIAPTPLPYPIFVLAGVILWQIFVEALQAPMQHLAASRQLITRSRLPHEAVILAGACATLLNAAIRLAVLLPVLLLFGLPLAPSMLLIPLGVAALVLLGLAIGVAAAPAGLLFDDVGRGLTMATSFWFFLTPVIYPLPRSGWLALNPVSPLLDTTRAWLSAPAMSPAFAIVVALSLAALGAAWILYRIARPHVVARLG